MALRLRSGATSAAVGAGEFGAAIAAGELEEAGNILVAGGEATAAGAAAAGAALLPIAAEAAVVTGVAYGLEYGIQKGGEALGIFKTDDIVYNAPEEHPDKEYAEQINIQDELDNYVNPKIDFIEEQKLPKGGTDYQHRAFLLEAQKDKEHNYSVIRYSNGTVHYYQMLNDKEINEVHKDLMDNPELLKGTPKVYLEALGLRS